MQPIIVCGEKICEEEESIKKYAKNLRETTADRRLSKLANFLNHTELLSVPLTIAMDFVSRRK